MQEKKINSIIEYLNSVIVMLTFCQTIPLERERNECLLSTIYYVAKYARQTYLWSYLTQDLKMIVMMMMMKMLIIAFYFFIEVTYIQ